MMNQSTAEIVIPVAHPQPRKSKLYTFFTAAYLILFQFVCHILTVASTTIRGRLVVRLRHIWGHYYRRVVFGGEGVDMPQSALGFLINTLFAFEAIKSQGVPGFPFQTHPLPIMFSVTSVLVYGLASAAERVVSCVGLDPASVYAVTAHLGN